MTRIPLGPVHFDLIDRPAVIDTIKELVARRVPSQIITLNALMYNCALRDSALAEMISKAALIVADSVGIVLGVRLLTGAKVSRVPGIDIVRALCALTPGYSVFFLGAKPGVAERAAKNIAAACPGMTVAGTHHGYFSKDEEAAVITAIRASKADILFAGLAIPAQERWITEHLTELGVPVVMGVGGSFDVLSGDLRRAPVWMQHSGLEWLFRLIQQPSRLLRMTDLPVFLINMLKLKLNNSRYARHPLF